MVQPEATDGNIIWRMRMTRCITTATNTPSEYVIFIAFPLQQWSRERSSMLHLCLGLHSLSFNFCTKGIY